HILTLAEECASVKNSRAGCCAIANGLAWKPTALAQLSPCSGAQGCHSGSGKCGLQNHKPHRSQKRWPGSSHGSSMHDTPWQIYSLVFTSFELIAYYKSQKTILAEEGHQRAGSTTPTLLTPLHAIYTRPSEVAAIFRTVPPPEGMLARAKLSVFGSNRTMVLGFTPDSLYQTIPSGVIAMPYGCECSVGTFFKSIFPVRGSNLPTMLATWSVNHSMPWLSKTAVCGSSPFGSGILYSETTPVRGSSFPM